MFSSSVNTTTLLKYLSYEAKLNSYYTDEKLKEAMNILYEMENHGIPTNFDTYALLLQVCTHSKSLEDGRTIHANLFKSRFKMKYFLGCKLVDMYVKFGNFKDAYHLFDKTSEWNVLF